MAELGTLVPNEWALTDWGTVDGRLLGVVTSRPGRMGWLEDVERAVSLYERDEDGFREQLRRVAAGFGTPDLTPGGSLSDVRGDGSVDCSWRVDLPPLRTMTVDPELTSPLPDGILPLNWRVISDVWSRDGRYLALLTRHSPRGIDDMGAQLSIYRLDRGANPVEVWRETNATVELLEDLAFQDLNADGNADIPYRTYCGCNYWRRSGGLAATILPDGRTIDMPFVMPPGRPGPRGPEDVDGDGVYEWRVVDAAWESVGFSHAGSPFSMFILAWNGVAYADASPLFADAILSSEGDPTRPQRGDERYLSALVARFLDYYNSGRTDDAQRLLVEMRTYEFDDCMDVLRDGVVASLEDDPHESTLTVPSRRVPSRLPATPGDPCAYR